MELPACSPGPFQLAVGGKTAPLERLKRHGWDVIDGPQMSLTPQAYQEFISESKGELSIAKHVYVALQSGWFSSRSVCYLAAGRPVVVQDTGFSFCLPVGKGLIPFHTMEEAVKGIKEVEENYTEHGQAARDMAHEYFDSAKVLQKILDDL